MTIRASCPRFAASWVSLHGKEFLPLRLQHELVLGPGATLLLRLAPHRPRVPSAHPALSQGGRGALPLQGGGMAEQKAQLVALRGVVNDFLKTGLLICILKGVGKRQFENENKL